MSLAWWVCSGNRGGAADQIVQIGMIQAAHTLVRVATRLGVAPADIKCLAMHRETCITVVSALTPLGQKQYCCV